MSHIAKSKLHLSLFYSLITHVPLPQFFVMAITKKNIYLHQIKRNNIK